MTIEERIGRLEEFKLLIERYEQAWKDHAVRAELRTEINQELRWVRQEIIAAHCLKLITVSPPPITGGMVIQNADPFNLLFVGPYGVRVTDVIVDMIDETIGVLRLNPPAPASEAEKAASVTLEIQHGYAFVAMPMASETGEFDDVLDAIKEAAHRCGIQAERVDDPASTDRITDRIIESIQRAEFVIADLTDARPNVYYEAGYAHGIGKVPIYVARHGTRLEFDLKDYPVIFYRNLRSLKDDLEKRLRRLGGAKHPAISRPKTG